MAKRERTVLTVATFIWLGLALVAMGAAAVLVSSELLTSTADVHLGDVLKGWDTAVLVPAYWIFVLLIILAEKKWPAEKRAGTLTTGGAVDLVWLLVAPLFSLTIVALFLTGLQWVYDTVLRGASLNIVAIVGAPIAAVLAFLLADLGMWFTHFIRHKVPVFWQFHMVHHSQEQMSILTDNRVHFIEAMVSATIVYIPLRLVGLSDQASVALSFATVFITGFTHANLRTNVGPLRWIFVTPQFHRLHHSVEAEHWDHNFGAVLSIWDRMFGTAVRDSHVYPSTGLGPSDFPVETEGRWTLAPAFYARQVAYPFTKVWAMARG